MTGALAVFVGSAALVAVTVTLPLEGTAAGAVYEPLVDTVPIVELPPKTPLTLQVTPVLVEPLTEAANCWVFETATVAFVGDMVIDTAAVMLTPALAVFVGSAALVAATVTAPPEGTVEGAEYKPLEDTVPTVELPPAIPFTLQVAAVFVVPLIVAVNCWLWETCTDAAVGDRVIETAGVIATVA